MNRKRASVRREEILAATVEEIEASGLRTLRVADVAKRLGLSPSLVIYHFVTKEALVAAAFAHAGDDDLYRARRIAASGRSARERLGEVLAWYLPSGSTRSWKIWMDGWAAAMFDEELRRTFAYLDRQWKALLADLISAGAAAGDFELGASTEALAGPGSGAGGDRRAAESVATRILSYLDGLSVQRMIHPGSTSREEMVVWAEEFVVSLLGPGGAAVHAGAVRDVLD